ncbi:Beta-xylosidase [Pustulibacterium marinum]|uniref:Beta-xylosidase n=1 Tax=Pustulibacterium marinum TaxID=1224947 RepID=A0A1I7I0M2_9FLAO|nr:family 43 glycosylhydrolase [Pustulibacterium marinum]SFU66503.1 Beta-xylosidase [Pustulibacterium marinum]
MKQKLILTFIVLCSFVTNAQYQRNENQNKKTYTNPIFSGDYADPSLLKDGDDYYIVHSSFEYYPGLTIFHSKDLINWTPVQSTLQTYVGSVWAPDLVKYNGKYYIYFPAVDTNYVIWSDRIEGPWSEPINLNIGNIDPGHVVDDEGNRYLYFSNGGYVALSKDGLSVTSELKHTYDGWEIPREWSIECFCMEGPKLFKKGDYYYLTVAEGGTAGPATGHMVVSARSKTPFGPWENSPYNPIIRTEKPGETWNSMGHGTIFEGPKKQWYMVFHGYEKDFYNMGRQTMLSPVEWTKDGWFKIPDNIDVSQPINLPLPKSKAKSSFSLSDDFEAGTLQPQWKFFQEYEADRYSFSDGALVVKGKGNGIAGSSPLLTMPHDHSYTADIELEIEGDAVGGIVLFYNNAAFSGILTDGENILTNLRGWQFPTEKEVVKNKKIFLRLKNTNNLVDMYYSTDGKNWTKTENSAEVSGMHHNVLSGFLALRIGLTATGNGKVHFKNFTYNSL